MQYVVTSDLALLSVNSFQRDLSDANALIRALALRVMAAIRVPIIRPLLLVSMQKCVSDSSPHVRKSVANALPNLMPSEAEAAAEEEDDLDGRSATPVELLELLQRLLADRVPAVLAAAAVAFLEIAPHRLDLLHPHYHSMVNALAEVDEWGQALLLEVLLRYVCANFPEPAGLASSGGGGSSIVRASSMDSVSEGDVAAGWNPNQRSSYGGGQGGFGGGGGGGSFGCGSESSSYGGIGNPVSPWSGGGAGHTAPYSGGGGAGGGSRSGSMDRLQTTDEFYADVDNNTVPATPPPRDLMYSQVPDTAPPTAEEAMGHSFGSLSLSTPQRSSSPAVTAPATDGSSFDMETREELAPLVKAVRMMLHSANGGVVLAAVALLKRTLPPEQLGCIVKPLCRLTRSSRPEIAYCALEIIHHLANSVTPSLFFSSLRDFCTNAEEPAYISNAKCRILASLTTPATVGPISKELTAHLRSPCGRLARAAASAVAECATRLPAVAEPCLGSLVVLLSCGDEATVATAIDAIRRVLQAPSLPAQPRVVTALALLLPQVSMPHARASLVWCVGAYLSLQPQLGAETCRQLLNKFADEPATVKLQILTLAAKCAATNLERGPLMLRYALDLAKYDLDCDVRARARLLAAIALDAPATKPAAAASLLDADAASTTATAESEETAVTPNALAVHAEELICPPKPDDALTTATEAVPSSGGLFALTSVSLLLGKPVTGGRPLPQAPSVRTDPSLRRAPSTGPPSTPAGSTGYQVHPKQDTPQGGFYDDVSEPVRTPQPPQQQPKKSGGGGDDDSEYSYYSDEEGEGDGDKKTKAKAAPQQGGGGGWVAAGNSPAAAGLADPLAPTAAAPASTDALLEAVVPSSTTALPSVPPRWTLLLDYTNGNGLNARWRFARDGESSSSQQVLLLEFRNHSTLPFTHISLIKAELTPEQKLLPFQPVTYLPPNSSGFAQCAIDLGGSRSPLRFHLATDRGAFAVELRPPQGALLKPMPQSLEAFESLRKKWSGMNQCNATIPPPPQPLPMPLLAATALQHMNAAIVADGDGQPLHLSACALHDGKPMLAVLEPQPNGAVKLAVHAEDAIGGNILLKELQQGLSESA